VTQSCQAQAHTYVGRGPARKLYSGPCVLELGHELDHLPASLAQERMFDQAFNAGVDAALAVALQALTDWRQNSAHSTQEVVTEAVAKVRR